MSLRTITNIPQVLLDIIFHYSGHPQLIKTRKVREKSEFHIRRQKAKKILEKTYVRYQVAYPRYNEMYITNNDTIIHILRNLENLSYIMGICKNNKIFGISTHGNLSMNIFDDLSIYFPQNIDVSSVERKYVFDEIRNIGSK